MYLINTSFAVEPCVRDRWFGIMNEHYIPLLLSRGYAVVAFSRVISVGTVDHFTYSLLVEVADMERYKELTESIFDEYLTVADPLFGSRVLWFTTLMKKMEVPE